MQCKVHKFHTSTDRHSPCPALSLEFPAKHTGVVMQSAHKFPFISALAGAGVPATGRRRRSIFYRIPALLLVGLLLLFASAMHAQTANVGELLIVPNTPTYVDAVTAMVFVYNDVGQAITGTINFSVDNGPAIPGTLNSEGEAFGDLGRLSIGSHTLSATYVGNNQYGTASKSITFQVSDAQFAYVGTQGTTLFGSGTVSDVEGVAVDVQDNLYISDKAASVVKKEDTFGNVTTIPLTGLKNPVGLALDYAGDLFVADTGNNRVVVYYTNGHQAVVPVTGLSGPTYLAYDLSNDILYIVDPGNGRIVSWTPGDGTVATIVTGMTALRGITVDYYGDVYFSDRVAGFMEYDGPGYVYPIYGSIVEPGGIASSLGEYLILSDTSTNAVIRYDNGDFQTEAGQIQINDGGNPAIGMAADSTGRVYLALGSRVDVVDPGSGRVPDAPVATNNNFSLIFQNPQGNCNFITINPQPASTFNGNATQSCSGTLGESSTHLNFAPEVAGENTGYFSVNSASDDIPLWGKGIAGAAAFTPGLASHIETGAGSIGGVAFDTVGNEYVTDNKNNAVYKITPSGTKTTLAFTGLSGPTQIAVDALGTVYVLSTGIDEIDALPTVGAQYTAYSSNQSDGEYPFDISSFSLDGDNNILVAGEIYDDEGKGGTLGKARLHTKLQPDAKVRSNGKVAPHGKTQPNTKAWPHLVDGGLYAIALVPGIYPPGIGFEHYGIVTSSLQNPATAVAIDTEENVYSADATGALFRWGIDGTTTTLSTNLSSPIGIAVDPSNTVYVLGSTSSIALIGPSGTSSIPVNGLYTPAGLALDRYGDILIGDQAGSQLTFLDRTQQNYVFGDVPVGTPETLDGSIGNIGNQSFTIDGPFPANSIFVRTTSGNACAAPAGSTPGTTIASGANCDLGYIFTPPSDGPFTDSGTLVTTPATLVGSTGGGVINLSGTGEGAAQGPQPVLTPASINFGSVMVGSTSAVQTATLSNTGGVPQGITGFGFFGTNTSSFSETNNCGASLAAGASCTISIACTPATAGALTANLGANFPSPEPQLSIALSCSGAVPATPQAALTPATANFGSLTAGTTSTAQTFTLTNSGNAPLAISGITLTGANASAFADTSACGATLATGASCTIAVTFTPSTAGSFSATLSVADNAAGSPQTSSLTGMGTVPPDFTITVGPAVLTVAPGAVAVYTVSLMSTNGSFTNPVALTATGLPSGTITFSPASATPGGSGAQSTMTVQTTTQLATNGRSEWPFAASAFAALLLLLPRKRGRSGRRLMNLACIVALLSIAASTIGCGGGFALPAKTYTITVTGTSGPDIHSTTVTLTVQ
jgi:sugar lactone lactonase YvrE